MLLRLGVSLLRRCRLAQGAAGKGVLCCCEDVYTFTPFLVRCASVCYALCAACLSPLLLQKGIRIVAGCGEGWGGALPERVFCAVTFLPAFTPHLACLFRYCLSPSNRGKGGKNTSADNPETVSRCGGGEACSLT